MIRTAFLLTLISTALLLFAGPGSSQPQHARPGSLLIFPLFNSTEGNNTLISVTNTNEDETSCRNGFRMGDVQLHYVYFSDVWAQSDTDEDLTPADTLTVLARGHNPNAEVGFLVVEARDPELNLPIIYNHLIGSAIVVNAEFDFQWSYTPYPFTSELQFDGGVASLSECHPVLDMPGDADGDRIDFDGMEYDTFPEVLLLDNFFGEGTPDGFPNVTFSNTLYLMSSQPGGPDLEDMTEVALVGYNNNERTFSRSFRFNCYLVTSLGELTGAVTQASLSNDGDPDELAGVATGWLKMRTDTRGGVARGFSPFAHALLGVFVQNSDIGGSSFVAGRELQYTGRRQTSLPRTF